MTITLPEIFNHFYNKVDSNDYISTIKKATNINNKDKFDSITNKILFENSFFFENILILIFSCFQIKIF